MFSIQSAQNVLDKIPTKSVFKLLVVIIFFKKYVHCDMLVLVVKINPLPCFLNYFTIAVPVFNYLKQQSWSLLV